MFDLLANKQIVVYECSRIILWSSSYASWHGDDQLVMLESFAFWLGAIDNPASRYMLTRLMQRVESESEEQARS